jgi:hypothetical protein
MGVVKMQLTLTTKYLQAGLKQKKIAAKFFEAFNIVIVEVELGCTLCNVL